jgi:hypothetical protein
VAKTNTIKVSFSIRLDARGQRRRIYESPHIDVSISVKSAASMLDMA